MGTVSPFLKGLFLFVFFKNYNNIYFISDSRHDEDKTGSSDGRITSVSTIRFRPSASDNGITWACEAEHPALTYSPLRSSVLLSVLRKSVVMIIELFMKTLNILIPRPSVRLTTSQPASQDQRLGILQFSEKTFGVAALHCLLYLSLIHI